MFLYVGISDFTESNPERHFYLVSKIMQSFNQCDISKMFVLDKYITVNRNKTSIEFSVVNEYYFFIENIKLKIAFFEYKCLLISINKIIDTCYDLNFQN